MKHKGIKQKDNIFTITVFIVLIVYAALTIILLGWGLMTIFKEKWDYADNMLGLPKKWVFSNISDVINSMAVPTNRTVIRVVNGVPRKFNEVYYVGFIEMAYNSIIWTFGGTFIASIGPLIMGYCMGRFDYKFNGVLNGIIIFSMSFSLIGGAGTSIQFRKMLGIFDNIYGEIFMAFGWCSINTMMYAGLFKGVAKEYHEAACMDGANEFTIMFRIMLPFAKNLYGTYFLIRIISAWNQYDQILYLLPSYPTVSYATYLMSVSKDVTMADPPHRMATAGLMVLPMTIIFIIFREKFLNNTSIGGLKG